MQFLISQVANPIFAYADSQVVKFALGTDHVVDALFESGAGNEAVHLHVFLLPDAVGL